MRVHVSIMPLTDHIAIYGGSFNPPHVGHQAACLWLLSALNAKRVLVAPTFRHFYGKDLADFNHRVEMCKIMVRPLYNRVTDRVSAVVSNIEKDLPLPNTTLNLVKGLKIVYGDNAKLAVVIGSDLVPDLHKWDGWAEVAAMTKIVAVGRAGFKDTETPLNIYQYPVKLIEISSSEIRKKITNKEPITGLVSHDVEKYIYENNIYP